MHDNVEVAVFGGGCFWCTEAVFSRIAGVVRVTSGYAGGQTDEASYEAVSTGRTGHAEVVKVEFDPTHVSYGQLLDIFFTVHDPTTLNKQGADVGTQYRSLILTTSTAQAAAAQQKIRELQASLGAGKKVTTMVESLQLFHDAESYHQQYYEKHSAAPYCSFIITPKLEKITQQFPSLLKQT